MAANTASDGIVNVVRTKMKKISLVVDLDNADQEPSSKKKRLTQVFSVSSIDDMHSDGFTPIIDRKQRAMAPIFV